MLVGSSRTEPIEGDLPKETLVASRNARALIMRTGFWGFLYYKQVVLQSIVPNGGP